MCLFLNIIHLDFASNIRFTDKILIQIIKSHSNLKYLNLRKEDNNRLIIDKGLYVIANLYYKLEYLNISDHKEISEIVIWNVIMLFIFV